MRFDADRREAVRGGRSLCACCGAPIRAKCGAIVAHHWAHDKARDCDPWYDTGAHGWHLEWQRKHPAAWCERVIGCHRADVLTPEGLVIEFQHSPLSPAEIAEREAYYSAHATLGMLWVWDARAFAERIEVTKFERSTGKLAFRWKSPRKSMFTCAARQWWDLGSGWMLKDVSASRGTYAAGCGTAWLARADWTEPRVIHESSNADLRALLAWRYTCSVYRPKLAPGSTTWLNSWQHLTALDLPPQQGERFDYFY